MEKANSESQSNLSWISTEDLIRCCKSSIANSYNRQPSVEFVAALKKETDKKKKHKLITMFVHRFRAGKPCESHFRCIFWVNCFHDLIHSHLIVDVGIEVLADIYRKDLHSIVIKKIKQDKRIPH